MKAILLPYWCKILGLIITISGFILTILYFILDIRFRLPVFAVYSSFMEVKTFAVFWTNFADELVMLLLVAGLSLTALSREKNEKEEYDRLRGLALLRAFYANVFLLLFSILFVFGTGFIYVLLLNMISFPLIYLLIFNLLRIKSARAAGQ